MSVTILFNNRERRHPERREGSPNTALFSGDPSRRSG